VFTRLRLAIVFTIGALALQPRAASPIAYRFSFPEPEHHWLQVDATFTGAPTVLPHVRNGRLRALAVSSPQRLATLPDVPTVAESGFPGFDADQWYGIVAPAGTPDAVVHRLNAEINKALQTPAVAQQLADEGAIPMPGSPTAFGDLIAREIPRWALVVKAGNVKPD